ncbi:MAG: hypothetical protein R6U84_04975 [Candidatus Cloacimonadales bacterium]
MKIKTIIFFAIFAVTNIWAFQPQKKDFVSDYQYSLYRSWLTKTEADIEKSAGISQSKVVKIFELKQQDVVVEYPWQDYQITEQRQKLEINFSVSAEPDLKPMLHYAENFIYRLNAAEKSFAQDLLIPEIELEYQSQKGQAALDLLWKNYQDQIIIPAPITIISQQRFGFQIPLTADDLLILWFAEASDLSEKMQNLKKSEAEAAISFDEKKLGEVGPTEAWISEKHPTTRTANSQLQTAEQLESLSLPDYVRKAYKIRQSKELLHNKISDVKAFLEEEYPQAELTELDNIFYLAKGEFNGFGGDIFLEFQQAADGILLQPFSDYRLQAKKMILPNGEEIELSALQDAEIAKIANSIPQLLYAHRALDSRLINFLMIHDDIPTTLIVHSEKRELYEVYSYANLLLMLSKYWHQHQLYFSLNEVKKVNGQIELVGYLAATNAATESYDMAEIWFRLDDDFRIDLIMMMLYPELTE